MSSLKKSNTFVSPLGTPEWQWYPELVLSRNMRGVGGERKRWLLPEALGIDKGPLAWQDIPSINS